MAGNKYFLNIWLTHDCNFRCKYCYVGPESESKAFKVDQIQDLMVFISNTIKEEQEVIVNFHGGEPLLNFQVLRAIVTEIKDHYPNKSRFGITTNGSLLNSESIHFLTENFDYSLSISIDGKQETHNDNRVCIKGAFEFDALVANACRVLDACSHTRIRMTFRKENISKLAENIMYFIDLGFRNINPVPDYYSMVWTDEDYQAIENQFAQVKAYIKSKGLDIEINWLNDTFHSLSRCSTGHGYFNVDVDGSLYSCTHTVGNQMHKIGSLVSGIDKSKIGQLDVINHKRIEACSECALVDSCISSRCLILNEVTMGGSFTPNPVFCNMNRVKVNLINASAEIEN